MLSATNTLLDIKSKLPTYDIFDYASDDLFEDDLISTCEDVMRLYFYPRLGTILYNRIAAKDKVSLTLVEENIYWAEIYTTCYEFIKFKNISGQSKDSFSETLAVEGYRFTTGNSLNKKISPKNYKDRMFNYWRLAGFNVYSLQRTCTIFGDVDKYKVYDDEAYPEFNEIL